MTEPRYVKVYCAKAVEREWPRRDLRTGEGRSKLGLVYAERVNGRWTCLCCGSPVSVAW